MNETLKPCPFCGGEAEMWDGRGTQAEVGCTQCGTERSLQVSDILDYEERFNGKNDFSMQSLSYPSGLVQRAKNELIKMWNERTND